ncbi:MAG: PAS domain-containing protein [Paracoccaceae bacterium]
MKFPAISQTEGYWDGLRGGAAIPMRSNIDPRGLSEVLEYAFILERIAPGVGRFRIAGMHIINLMGMEVRGMPLTSMFLPQARREISEIIEKVCDCPSIAVLDLQGDGAIGRAKLEAKMLMAPLKSDFGEVNRILGCLQSLGHIGRQPRRFRVTGVSFRELQVPVKATPKVPATLSAKTPAKVSLGQATAGFEEAPATFEPLSEPKELGKSGPTLQLVVNNE